MRTGNKPNKETWGGNTWHTTEPWHNSPLLEGVSHNVTVPPGRGGGRSGGPSGQTRTGTQDGDLQSGTDKGGHGGAGSSGGHGRWSSWPWPHPSAWPLQPEPFYPPKIKIWALEAPQDRHGQEHRTGTSRAEQTKEAMAELGALAAMAGGLHGRGLIPRPGHSSRNPSTPPKQKFPWGS